MHTISARNMLLRARVELPVGLKLATEEFREGWNFVRSGGARRLEKKIHTLGWNFIKIADESLRSGVGESSQEAIASALKLVLRRISTHFNAVEVEHIQLTQYPWFFLARVRVYPYRIQQDAVVPVSDEGPPDPIPARPMQRSSDSARLSREFGSTIPVLKEMLISSRISDARNY